MQPAPGGYNNTGPPVPVPCGVCGITLIGEPAFMCIGCGRQCHDRCGLLKKHCPWCYAEEKKKQTTCLKSCGKFWGIVFVVWFAVKLLLVIKTTLFPRRVQ